MSRPLPLFVTAAIALALLPAVASAQPAREPTDGASMPDRSVTMQNDSASVEVNPAGLGFMESVDLRYGYDLRFSRNFTSTRAEHALYSGIGTRWFGGGFSLQWLNRTVAGLGQISYQKMSLGAALRPLESLSTGLSLNLFGSLNNRALNRLVSFDLGFQWRPSQFLGFGLAVKDTNHPFFRRGQGVPVRVEPGVALRLLDGKFVVDSQVRWTPARGSLRALPRLTFEPLEGLQVFGRADLAANASARNRDGAASRVSAGLEVSLGGIGLQSSGTVVSSQNQSARVGAQTQQVRLSSDPRPSVLPSIGRWVRLDLTQPVSERASNSLFAPSSTGFLELLNKLRAMRSDERVEGVVLEVGDLQLGYAQVWDLRRQIERLQSAGKRAVAYLERPDFLEVYLASAVDRVFLHPSEPYAPEGLRVTTTSYAEALSNIGIEAEFLRIGEYKSAPEAFVRESPSKPSLEQTNALVDDLYGSAVESIADDRSLESSDVRAAIDEIPLYPDEAVRKGFVDAVLYPDELRSHLQETFGGVHLAEGEYDPAPEPSRGWEGGPRVAIVYVDGSIVRGKSRETPFTGDILTGSETLVETLEQLGTNAKVRGIVLRVDSPGGSAVASDTIYRAVRRVAEVKPVVASMGDVAASGGYYVASGADSIFATPNTVTGSIGIFAGKFNVEQLSSWVGISRTAIERGERAGRYDLYSPWSEEQKQSVAKSIEYLYQMFLQQAARERPYGAKELDKRARGRVWSGTDARDEKLVDRVGGLLDAIHHVEREAGIEPGAARYSTHPTPGSLLDMPFAATGTLRKLAEAIGVPQSRGNLRTSAVGRALRRLHRAVRLPLIYDQEQPLMLPNRAIRVETD